MSFIIINSWNVHSLIKDSLLSQRIWYVRHVFVPLKWGTGMIASSSTFRPHPGRVTGIYVSSVVCCNAL